MTMDDELIFAEEDEGPAKRKLMPWNVLIVDDEEEVHNVTQLALKNIRFTDRDLNFLHARSGAEAKEMMKNTADIALILLDVVMETDQAGLDVVEYVRNELGNKFVRIVLRTGQPGQAPEMDVITKYDINDYKHKTELTRERLFTTVYTSLTTYRDLIALDANRRGLEKVIEASADIFRQTSFDKFAEGVLQQLAALLFVNHDSLILHACGVAAAEKDEDRLEIIAGTCGYKTLVGKSAQELEPQILERILAAQKQKGSTFGTDFFVGYSDAAEELLFYVDTDREIAEADKRLIELFYQNVAIARSHLPMNAPT